MRNLFAGAAALLIVISPGLAWGAAAATTHLIVLAPAEIDPQILLPPPPQPGSPGEAVELRELRQIGETRSADRFKQAIWDNDHQDTSIYAAIVGAAITPATLPETAKLLAIVANDTIIASRTAKIYFRRRRPWAADPKLVRCDNGDITAPATSYPSGHSTIGFSFAFVLARLMPDKAQALQARAADYAQSRMVCGVHYHSDIEAGHVLGIAIAEALLSKPALQSQMAAARAELRARHLTGQ